MNVDEIRDRFLKFFEERGHRIYPSDSLVHHNDPSLLFTGAGMNQFKEEFLGRVKGSRRAATCQKCLRTGDLENVGKTPGHHTFFEMLGNFSFGDYFKKEAIEWAWEFLTKDLGLKQDDLWVSVFKDDKEAYDIWKDIIRVPEKKILSLGEKENFWPSNAPSKGPNGPCGPCSEIFYGGPDGVEVWNLVFTQFDRCEAGKLEHLPNKNIDTGMGLERIARVLQGKNTNFEIDSFQPITKAISDLSDTVCRCTATHGVGQNVNAIVDHIRAVTFAISDGVLPSNEERGYVIRKLIRKACWHGRSFGQEKPFLYKIVPVVASVMRKPYPELTEHRENISQIVLEEEKRFRNTLDEGIQRLQDMMADAKGSGLLSGESAFKLYDTYGFPLELTHEISGAENIKVDVESFEKLMESQRLASKSGSKIKSDIFQIDGKSDIKLPDATVFIEDKEEIETNVVQIGPENNFLFLERSNFYGEKGGQIGDTGTLLKDGKVIAEVTNAIDITGRVQHLVKMKKGVLKVGDTITARIDRARREDIKRNHTATHLLHNALRKVLGPHVKQAGSLVAPDRLRFDFSHFKAVTDEELSRIEEIVNENINKNSVVRIDETSLEEARKKDAIALFGEKYGEKVRMVSVGDYSRELCGGTHVAKTGEIGVFKIISESSIASGMRRIEAITGKAAYKKIKEEEGLIKEIANELKTQQGNIAKEIERLGARLKQLEKALEVFINKNALENVDNLLKSARKIKGLDIVLAEVKEVDAGILRRNADIIKDRLENGLFVLISEKDGKLAMIVGLAGPIKDDKLDAVRILNEIGIGFGIKGGGRKDFAQAGSRSGPDIKDILRKAEETIKAKLA